MHSLHWPLPSPVRVCRDGCIVFPGAHCKAAGWVHRACDAHWGVPMMPLLMGLDMLWQQLERLEHEHRPEALRRPGYKYYDDFDDLEARAGRVQRLRSVLFFSGVQAEGILAERLAGINLSGVLRILVDACKDVALYWGGSVLAGGALGGAFGALGGGVGALPGAAVGAGLGTQIGAWVLGILGLKALLKTWAPRCPRRLATTSAASGWRGARCAIGR